MRNKESGINEVVCSVNKISQGVHRCNPNQ